MGAKLSLFNAVAAALQNVKDSNGNPAFREVRKWNNQVQQEPVNNAVRYPSAFISFSEIAWMAQEAHALGGNFRGKQQKADITVTVYCVFEKYNDETDSWPEYEPITRNVWLEVTTIPGGGEYGQLTRSAEREDVDHNNLVVWEIDFTVMIFECMDIEDMQDVNNPVGNVTLDLSGDLIIDPSTQDGIRTEDQF